MYLHFKIFNISGKVDCVTVSSDKHKPCVFPVLWKGEYHDKCILQSSTGKHWCATELKSSGKWKRFGHCGDSCPKEEEWTIKLFLRTFQFFPLSKFLFHSWLFCRYMYFILSFCAWAFNLLVKLCWYNQNMTSKSIQKN